MINKKTEKKTKRRKNSLKTEKRTQYLPILYRHPKIYSRRRKTDRIENIVEKIMTKSQKTLIATIFFLTGNPINLRAN